MSNFNRKSTPITVHNKEINETHEFSTMRKAAEFFNMAHSQIIYYLKTKSFLGVYTLLRKKTLQNNYLVPSY